MRKILLSLGLLAVMIVCTGGAFAADEDNKPKKGKFGEKLKGKLDTDKLFEKLDANSDGKISKEEFKKVFDVIGKLAEKVGEKAGALADVLFARLDADSDGYLSKEEFKKFGANVGNFGQGGLKDRLKGLKGKFGKKGEDKKDEKKEDKKEEKKEDKKDQ